MIDTKKLSEILKANRKAYADKLARVLREKADQEQRMWGTPAEIIGIFYSALDTELVYESNLEELLGEEIRVTITYSDGIQAPGLRISDDCYSDPRTYVYYYNDGKINRYWRWLDQKIRVDRIEKDGSQTLIKTFTVPLSTQEPIASIDVPSEVQAEFESFMPLMDLHSRGRDEEISEKLEKYLAEQFRQSGLKVERCYVSVEDVNDSNTYEQHFRLKFTQLPKTINARIHNEDMKYFSELSAERIAINKIIQDKILQILDEIIDEETVQTALENILSSTSFWSEDINLYFDLYGYEHDYYSKNDDAKEREYTFTDGVLIMLNPDACRFEISVPYVIDVRFCSVRKYASISEKFFVKVDPEDVNLIKTYTTQSVFPDIRVLDSEAFINEAHNLIANRLKEFGLSITHFGNYGVYVKNPALEEDN